MSFNSSQVLQTKNFPYQKCEAFVCGMRMNSAATVEQQFLHQHKGCRSEAADRSVQTSTALFPSEGK